MNERVSTKKQREFGNTAGSPTQSRAVDTAGNSYGSSPRIVAQRAELDKQFGASRAITQLRRGKTKYGAMIGKNVQGPHTIAHSTIAAIESMANLDSVTRFETYKSLGIILPVAEVKALVNKDRQPGDPKWLTDRYEGYIASYEKCLDCCEYWRKQVNRCKPNSDKQLDALIELDGAVTDIRDMHPSSTYGGDLEHGATPDMLAGKGERSESIVKGALEKLTPGNFTGLKTEIMIKADVNNLTSTDDVHKLRDAYAELAARAMKWK